MQKREYRIGPGASSLLMILVILVLTTLGVLGFISARADLRLSNRALAMAEAYYSAAAAGEEHLAELDAILAKSTDKSTVSLPDWAEWTEKQTIVYSEPAGDGLAVYVTVPVVEENGSLRCGAASKKLVSLGQ